MKPAGPPLGNEVWVDADDEVDENDEVEEGDAVDENEEDAVDGVNEDEDELIAEVSDVTTARSV